MITDTQRLDWLEERRETVYEIQEQLRVPRTDGTNDYDIVTKHWGWSVSSRHDECSSIRDAIDAGINDVKEDIFDPVKVK